MVAKIFATPGGAADPVDFKRAMRHLVGAVSVVTVGTGERLTGFTATSVSSLSVEPPTILVSLNRSSSSWKAILESKAFAVNVLAAEQIAVANRFAGLGGEAGEERYRGAEWLKRETGSRLLVGAVSTIDCVLEEAIERHSHAILIGRVQSVEVDETAQPLAYFNRSFRTLAE